MTPPVTPNPQDPAAGPAPAGPGWRATTSHYLLMAGAIGLGVMALIQMIAYGTAAIALSNSGLSEFYRNIFRGLWLGFPVQLMLMAGILAVAIWRPGSVTPVVLSICGLLPLLNGAIFMAMIGSWFGASILLVVAVAILAGAFLQPRPAPRR